MRLHSRLVLANFCIIGLLLAVPGYFIGSSLQRTIEDEVKDELLRTARLARLHFQQPGSNDAEVTRRLGELLDLRVSLISPDGVTLADSSVAAEARRTPLTVDPEVAEAFSQGTGMSVRLDGSDGTSLIYVAALIDGSRVVRLALPLSRIDRLMSSLWTQFAALIGAMLALTVVFGWIVRRAVSTPLQQMAAASRILASGDLDHRIATAGDSDLAAVGSSLNSMALALKSRWQELREDQARTDAILSAMDPGVVLFDSQLRVVFSNRSLRRLFDLSADPAGRTPLELFRNLGLDEAVRAATAGQIPKAVDLATLAGRSLSVSTTPIRAGSGEVRMVLLVVNDYTEIRKTERMRRDFVINVSHEFKTPLTSIRGYAETLLDAEGPSGIQREFLDAILRNAGHLQSLVDDLMVLARLESELPLSEDEVHLRQLVDEQARLKENVLRERGLTLNVSCAEIVLTADASRLTKAVSNLIDNAIHYNSPGGSVQIVASAIDGRVQIAIADTGQGIAGSEIHRIFERFYRVDKSRSRHSGGTGLGLAIVKHAIESQGGTVTVTSKVGAGSTFTISLPLRSGEANRSPAAS